MDRLHGAVLSEVKSKLLLARAELLKRLSHVDSLLSRPPGSVCDTRYLAFSFDVPDSQIARWRSSGLPHYGTTPATYPTEEASAWILRNTERGDDGLVRLKRARTGDGSMNDRIVKCRT